jgi:hypothetical protein
MPATSASSLCNPTPSSRVAPSKAEVEKSVEMRILLLKWRPQGECGSSASANGGVGIDYGSGLQTSGPRRR